VPANSLAVRRDLDPALKIKLRNLLLEMDYTEEGKAILREFGAKKFIATSEKDYDPVFIYADKVKLDLKKYNYWND
jgi:ABC-type phosphate/phosphonate transport system substrate-binding protein